MHVKRNEATHFEMLVDVHYEQLETLECLKRYLEAVATAELKCAQIMNELEEDENLHNLLKHASNRPNNKKSASKKTNPTDNVLSSTFLSFLDAFKSSVAQKALQSWEYSEAI